MKSAIFTSGFHAYQVSNIIYAGPVQEIPEERRRNGSTHSFKVLTALGAAYCYYKDVESARKARGALGAMLDTLRPNAFKHGNEYVDPKSVVSFSYVRQFKKPVEECTHGFVVTMLTSDEKNRDVWIRYRSEEHARKGRKVMWAALHSANGLTASARQDDDGQPVAQEAPVASDSVPF
ncbi:MAG: hypothetical protein GF418_05250 [Chitinivibrionales bacterium]|nr:hypothetical protein [Chitinivibrionales bacterium]MBD3395017.1 hypothetical protein [Chitinivibrionales bacterium]